MNPGNLSHNELIAYIAQKPRDQRGWNEFYQRFHHYLFNVIECECQRIAYHDLSAEDILQEVYQILIKNDCAALKKFQGRYEGSIFLYLKMTGIRVVYRRKNESRAQKRPPSNKGVSLQQPVGEKNAGQQLTVEEILRSPQGEQSIKLFELMDAVNHCLDDMAAKRRQGSIYKAIYKLYLYERYSVETIYQKIQEKKAYSIKRIRGIITEVQQYLQDCLQKNF